MNKYRVCPWYNIYKHGAPIEHYGIEIKTPKMARYRHLFVNGELVNFPTKDAALQKIAELKAEDAKAATD